MTYANDVKIAIAACNLAEYDIASLKASYQTPTNGFFQYNGLPTIDNTHPCAQGLLWDGFDSRGQGVFQRASMPASPSGSITPPFDFTTLGHGGVNGQHLGPPDSTPWGPAVEWTAWAKDLSGNAQQGATGYGCLGWLNLLPSGLVDPNDPIRKATRIDGQPVGTGWTVACTYIQSLRGYGGTGNLAPPWIFGRFLNAGEAPSGQVEPFAAWGFVETSKMDVDFGYGRGSGINGTVGFCWTNGGVPMMIDWVDNPPPPGSLVKVVATAVVEQDGTQTVSFWGGYTTVNGQQVGPTLIGQVSGQHINDYSGNNEDMIGWDGILHWQTGEFTSCHYGYVLRGNFNIGVWPSNVISDYMINSDCYHVWQ